MNQFPANDHPDQGSALTDVTRVAAMRQRNAHLMSAAALACLDKASVGIDQILNDVPERDQQLFRIRLARWFQNLYDGLLPVYGRRDDFDLFMQKLVRCMAAYHVERSDELKGLDIERDLEADWFQHETMLGYVFYVEQFADKLDGVQDHIDYLQEIGASYVHLMKVMQSRDGENDGGYAVTDYRKVAPALGTNDDLEA